MQRVYIARILGGASSGSVVIQNPGNFKKISIKTILVNAVQAYVDDTNNVYSLTCNVVNEPIGIISFNSVQQIQTHTNLIYDLKPMPSGSSSITFRILDEDGYYPSMGGNHCLAVQFELIE